MITRDSLENDVVRLRAEYAEARVALLTAQLQEAKEDAGGSWECLEMVRETIEANGLSMKGCPPMCYNDAVRNLVTQTRVKVREAAIKVCKDALRNRVNADRDCIAHLHNDAMFADALNKVEVGNE